MPAQPLTDEQKADAERLRTLFKKWQGARKDQRLPASQAEAAELLGLGFGQSAFSQYLRGDIPLNVRVVAAFAVLLGCPPEEISPALADELHRLAVADNHNSATADKPISGSNIGQTVKSPYDVAATIKNEPTTSQGSKITGGRASVSARPIAAWDREEELGDEYVLIPRLDVKFSAGNGKIAWHVDEKGQKQAFRRAWCQRLGINPEHAATIVNEGQSMEPRLIDGDSLVVDYKATNIIDGKVYALAYQGELFVKRLFKLPNGGLRVQSDNPDKTRFPDMNLSAQDVEHVEIIARVMGVSGAV